jgi:ATP-dependent Clp protease ATP-binding subunit ClpA
MSINGKNGARDLRNLIRKEVEDKLSTTIIQNGGFDIGSIQLIGNPELGLIIEKS